MLKTMSAGTRSLFALGALIGLSSVTVLTLELETETPDAEPVEEVVTASLASLPVDPEDFGLGAALEVRPATLKRRETLSDLVNRLDLPGNDGHQALYSLTRSELLNARRVRPGLEVKAHVEGDTLNALSVDLEPGRRLMAKRMPGGEYKAFALDSQLIPTPYIVKGSIETSLYQDAQELGAEDQQVVDFAQVFAYDLDFQREVHPGDEFEMVFDVLMDERGNVIRRGDVLYASLNGKAVTKSFYRFTTPDEKVTDYFQANGESSTKFLMKTPINGARLSSRFGKRRHPISGYTRLHKGTDFAAPTGTPIYAAGNGVVERASRYGGYGHYVRIRHAKGYKTAYAHMSRYGRGVRSGRSVRQGQIIGYVGSTGASTGPHLHYEVYKNGKPVDAMRLKLPTGRKLAMDPEIFEVFEVERDRVDAIRATQQAPDESFVTASVAPPAP
ncbi:MAG: M23 family metallopeptidase [Hyphomonadaceae bacterium]|nr:M23 family metallopeptidase [Hyphomonadaceae bacterium]